MNNSDKRAPTLPPLMHEWNTSRNAASGWPQFLESVQIDGVRGWIGEMVEFRFPVVAIAGENGAGKSTVLKTVASAYFAQQEGGATFYPDDFFPNTPWESVEGVVLKYQYRLGDATKSLTVRKKTSRWRGMPERPRRPVYFLDISRTQPVNTLVGYGKIAKELNFPGDVMPFSDDDRGLLSRIMKRSYTSSSMARFQNKQIGLLTTEEGEYSNFHQGAGEDATADLVALLRAAPRHSLVIIDEVEASLHPRAQRRLMTELLDIARDKRIQFILSTHSSTVLEQLPTEARIYIQGQRGTGHNVIYGVTPKFAMSLMDDLDHPELVLYCEDERAQVLIDSLITHELPDISSRISIVPVGAASAVRVLGNLATESKLPNKSLGILDADQVESSGCILLPGSLAPERELFQSLKEDDWSKVAQLLDVRPADLMEAVEDACQLNDHHTWVRRVAEGLGPRVRTKRVWEDITSVWSKSVIDPAVRSAFVASIQKILIS